MQKTLPATLKIKDQEIKTESLSESAKRILADVIAAEEEAARAAASLRMLEIARKELLQMLEKEVNPA